MELVDRDQLDYLLHSPPEVREVLDRLFTTLTPPPESPEGEGEWKAWGDKMHQSRGLASISGFPRLSQAFGDAETAARSRQGETEAWQRLQQIWEDSKAAYHELRSGVLVEGT